MKYQTFKVSGRGQFPMDMLRYDDCFPRHQTDVTKITESLQMPVTELTVYELARNVQYKSETPTIKRWESFRFNVFDVETR